MGLTFILVWTRFTGIQWGLPYLYHPDERNIAVAITGLSPASWYRPDFYAYGQLLLYLGYVVAWVINIIIKDRSGIVSLGMATLALRILSAVSACITAIFVVRIMKFIRPHSLRVLIVVCLITIFCPAIIQFAHFGTTESILMASYTALTYYSLLYFENKRLRHIGASGVALGLAAAAKISAGIFALLPLLLLIFSFRGSVRQRIKRIMHLIFFGLVATSVFIIASPYNILSFGDFRGAINYESAVALGTTIPFYTRQFVSTVPVFFQFTRVFPYALGWGIFIFFLIGFVILPRDKNTNILRLAFLTYFIPTAFLYAKWSRFMAPAFPIAIIIAALVLDYLYDKLREFKKIKEISFFSFWVLIAILCLPGIAYLHIYQVPDVRVQSSRWIYEHIPAGSNILFETANVVDIPVQSSKLKVQNYQTTSFDFYSLDSDDILVGELKKHIEDADYIFVPSRRIFADHTCLNPDGRLGTFSIFNGHSKSRCDRLEKEYPRLNEYYRKLFSGNLGFVQVAKFTSYPTINFLNNKLFEQKDEEAEETWTVFDHPVIRIYKRV